MHLLLEKACDPVTMAYILKLTQNVTEHLNPGQVPWIETDIPLYMIAKRLQWKYSERFGKDKMLVTMGVFI